VRERCILAVQGLQAYEEARYSDAVRLFAESARKADCFFWDPLWLRAALQKGVGHAPLLDYCRAHEGKAPLLYRGSLLQAFGPAEERKSAASELVKIYEEEFEAMGKPASMRKRLAYAYDKAGDIDGAAAVFEALAQESDTPQPWVDLAAFWQRNGKSARAKGCMEAALDLCDSNDVVRIKRLRALKDGKWDKRGQPWAPGVAAPPRLGSLTRENISPFILGMPDFVLPTGETDQYGKPVVRRGGQIFDPVTGYPFEIWMKSPRIEFVLVLPGEFTMGVSASDAKRVSRWKEAKGNDFSDEQPPHSVMISKPYYLGKYELSQEQWQKVMIRKPWVGQTYDTNRFGKGLEIRDSALQPACYMSWYDCQRFLAVITGVTPGKRTVRLPTEAEWEYACRAGTTTLFHFGNDRRKLKDYAIVGQYTALGVFWGQPNAWGFSSMHGNVWEWCQDAYGPFTGDQQTDPTGPQGEGARVGRGGFFGSSADFCLSTNRVRLPANAVGAEAGMRLAASLP